jgi:hypothetical protein
MLLLLSNLNLQTRTTKQSTINSNTGFFDTGINTGDASGLIQQETAFMPEAKVEPRTSVGGTAETNKSGKPHVETKQRIVPRVLFMLLFLFLILRTTLREYTRAEWTEKKPNVIIQQLHPVEADHKSNPLKGDYKSP